MPQITEGQEELARRQVDAGVNDLVSFLHVNGDALSGQGHRKEALEKYQEALRWRPDSSAIAIHAADCLIALKRPDEAIALSDQVITRLKARPAGDEGILNLAGALAMRATALMSSNQIHKSLADFGDAVRVLRPLAARAPDMANGDLATALLQQATALLWFHKDAEALAPLEEARALWNKRTTREEKYSYNAITALLIHAYALNSLGRYDEMAADLRSAEEQAIKAAAADGPMKADYERLARYARANHAPLLGIRAIALCEDKRFDQALEQLVKADSVLSGVINDLRDRHKRSDQDEKDYQQYVRALKSILRLKANTLFQRGVGHLNKDRWGPALGDFQDAVRVASAIKDTEPADVLTERDNLLRMIRSYQFFIFFRRSSELKDQGKIREATVDYDQAARLGDRVLADEDDPKARQELSELYAAVLESYSLILATSRDADLRDGVRALELAKRANQLTPKEHNILYALAAAYAEAGDFDGAVRFQSAALEAAANGGVPEGRKKYYRQVLRLFQEKKPLRLKSP